MDKLRRIFLEVDDAARVASEIERALFVPTRLPLNLGDVLVLGLRLPRAKRSLEVAVVVVGRRPARAGSLLSAGIQVRVRDANDPMLELLREVATGRVVDLEARMQERLRLPATVRFAHHDEARAELLGLLGEDGAILALGPGFVRGDRLFVDVVVANTLVFQTNVLVKRQQTQDGAPSTVCVALDDAAKKTIGDYLNDEDSGVRRA